MQQNYEFPDVTLLVTHYNRSSSLENLLASFKQLNCKFGGIVVSDDGSQEKHITYMKDLQKEYDFRLITTPQNKGLGNNINKGQDAVQTPFTLYIQEDFEPSQEFPAHLVDSLKILREHPEFDIVRYYAYLRYPYLKPFTEAFSEMVIPAWATNYNKIYYYSDHPHLRRSTFFEKFGRYAEGIHPDKTEYRMSVAFIRNKGRGLFYNDYQNLFYQKNSEDEPSTIARKSWTVSGNPILVLLRDIYKQIKFNHDIYFMRL
ncbi:glycosyltransferase family 2 protein [Spirosoma sp.]|uniref:glycosyltransferase family 2 protein n=1 Tax=Spirosoma sp. TaxID=1899569 RepID=UPI003B3A6556